MRHTLFIVLFFASKLSAQSFEKFRDYTSLQLASHKGDLEEYYQYFKTLIGKRDTAYLKERISTVNSDKIYLIEGYNFKTGQYSFFEEYAICDSLSNFCGTGNVYLDKKQEPYGRWYFMLDTVVLQDDYSKIDSILPRLYRYGAGCVIDNRTKNIFQRLRRKADQDGTVIETYCRVETMIDKRTNKIWVKYCIPVYGKREVDLKAGWGTDYPEGLDFWLFVSPYYQGK